MSSQDDTDATILLYNSILLNNYCTLASAVFLAYEYVITIHLEIELFWRSKWTGATMLFFANRYIVLLDYSLLVAQFAPMSDQSCVELVKFESVIDFLQYVPFTSFSTLRAYALSDQNLLLSAVVFLLGLVPLACDFAQFHFGLTGVNDPLFGCSEDNNLPSYLAKRFTVSSRTSLIISDILLLVLTWYTVAYPRRMRPGSLFKLGGPGISIVEVMLRDGVLYFMILLILNVLHLTFTQLAIFQNPLNPTSFITNFTSPITAVLISRFLLDLQAANRRLRMSSSMTSLDERDASASNDFTESGAGTRQGGLGPLIFAGFDVLGSVGSHVDTWAEDEETYGYRRERAHGEAHGCGIGEVGLRVRLNRQSAAESCEGSGADVEGQDPGGIPLKVLRLSSPS